MTILAIIAVVLLLTPKPAVPAPGAKAKRLELAELTAEAGSDKTAPGSPSTKRPGAGKDGPDLGGKLPSSREQWGPSPEAPPDYVIPPEAGTPIDDVRLDDPWTGGPIYVRNPDGGPQIIVIDDPGSVWWILGWERTALWQWLIRYRPDLLWTLARP